MMQRRTVDPDDLPTKVVRAPDGSTITMKVVQADSPTFGDDFLAAFRDNVRRIRREQQRLGIADADDAA